MDLFATSHFSDDALWLDAKQWARRDHTTTAVLLTRIAEIDTRRLVRHIRAEGAMRGVVSTEVHDADELQRRVAESPAMEGAELAFTFMLKPVANISGNTTSESFLGAACASSRRTFSKFAGLFSHAMSSTPSRIVPSSIEKARTIPEPV